MTRTLTIAFLAVLLVAALGAIWYSLGMPGVGPKPPETSLYKNTRFDYQFTYPRTYTLEEYTNRYVTLGNDSSKGRTEMVSSSVLQSEEGQFYPTFGAFLTNRLSLLCAADSPDKTYECATVAERTPMRNGTGTFVTEYYLNLVVHTTATGATETKRYGPLYVFDISKDNLDSTYSALIVYPPVASFDANKIDEGIVKKVADRISFTGQTQPAAPADFPKPASTGAKVSP